MFRRFVLLTLGLSLLVGPVAAEDLWLAAGYGGRRMISRDGLRWEITAEWAQPGGDDSNNLMSAVFAQDKFVVVGGGGGGASSAGHILVSKDGRQWQSVHRDKARVNPVVFGAGRFVVGRSGYPSGSLLWSSDGEQWQSGASIRTKGLTHFRGGAYGNGVFVLVGNGGAGGKTFWAITSPDGEQIANERDDLPGHGTIVFGAGRFLMLTSHSDAQLISSVNGADWEEMQVEEGATFNWLVWTGGEFIVGDGKSAYRSADGNRWQAEAMSPRGSVKWSDGQRFIASAWPGKMSFSTNGKDWEQSPELTANGINVVLRSKSPE